MRKRIEKLTLDKENVRKILHDAYSLGNNVLHSGKVPSKEDTKMVIEQVRSAVIELYVRFSRKIADNLKNGETQ